MNKIKLTTLAILASLGVSGAALADNANANFSTTVQSFCTVGQTAPGIMHLDGVNLTTDTPAEMVVNNNDANKYQVSISKPSDFATRPNSYTGSTTFTSAFGVTGANATVNPVPNDTAHNLANIGTDNLSISLFGTSDVNYTAGDYTAVVVASCVAQ